VGDARKRVSKVGRVIWIWVEAVCLSKAGQFVGSWDVDFVLLSLWLSKAGQFCLSWKVEQQLLGGC
jgi:hypothetical protein